MRGRKREIETERWKRTYYFTDIRRERERERERKSSRVRNLTLLAGGLDAVLNFPVGLFRSRTQGGRGAYFAILIT